METRIELYGCTGRMRGVRARARTARTCMTERAAVYTAVFARPRGVRAASARERGRFAHAIASEVLYAVLEQKTPTCCLPRRVRFQDAAICCQVAKLPQFEVRCARREHCCSLPFRTSDPIKTGLVRRVRSWQIPIIAPD